MMIEYNGVKIGDKFYKTPNQIQICEVFDFIQEISMKTGECFNVYPLARIINSEFSTNSFQVAFATIKRNKIK
jgi:hypothetical protein